ncbi:cation-transporting ATPase [Perkinsela sp. CCAP 1560/4]|nr:cation-transporting ATPase [Perkinsela sp. CCAP 1560/4]|eukprot:KNH07105.1 cation-transporting ATPase [Perkinsela sp. CCAP 1560/4]
MKKHSGKGCWYDPHVKTIFCHTCQHPVVVPFIVRPKRSRIGNEGNLKLTIHESCMRCSVSLESQFQALGCIGCEKLCCEKCIRIICDEAVENIASQSSHRILL